jgi:hypothetical protein
LAESQARRAERERAAETLAANAAELAVLKRALADGNEALLQRDTPSQALVTALENERSSAQRAMSALAETRECMRLLEKENAEMRTSVEELHADLLASAWTNEKFGVLEKSLEVSRQENAALRRQLQSLESPQRLVRGQYDGTAEAGVDHDCHRGRSAGAEYLELLLDGVLIRVVELGDGPSQVLVGRAGDCELQLDSRFVSRHHALISRCEDRVVIEDLNSHNGIFVDSRRVGRCELHPGSTVAIGNFRLHFRRGQPGKAMAGSAKPASSGADCADR